nr:lipoyl synthase [Bdellovibrio sp. CKG001]BFD63638.1 lipoyl synthase [Bdellovibrio sp. HM001]BFD66208.1 lipoyl synthase [Bdellovibrio sp. HAGR004]
MQKDTKTLEKPGWLKVRASTGETYENLKGMMSELKLATVCQSARCPNIGECWNGGTATIMIMGDVCTRGCRFCNVKTGNPKKVLDPLEPQKVAESIAKMNLEYVVITTVDRDDLPDQGAEHFVKTLHEVKKGSPNLIIEILAGDFRGDTELIYKLTDAKPDVYAHNVETVERLTPKVRDPRAGYRQSLQVLKSVKDRDPSRYTKTSLMLGLGETDEEILQTLKDLREIDCDVVTFGQYLQPTPRHLKVMEYVTPEKFDEWKRISEDMGFLYVASGPLVRSSYRAGEFFMKSLVERGLR